MSSITQTTVPVQIASPFDDPEYREWLDAIDRGHYEDEAPGFEPDPEDWAWLTDDDYGDDEDFSGMVPAFKTIEEWDVVLPVSDDSLDDLPPLSQDDRDRIEDWVMAHTEDLDARREWHPEGGGR